MQVKEGVSKVTLFNLLNYVHFLCSYKRNEHPFFSPLHMARLMIKKGEVRTFSGLPSHLLKAYKKPGVRRFTAHTHQIAMSF